LLKCTKSFVGWGSAPHPAVEAYSAPQTLYLDFRGPTSKEGGEEEGAQEGRGGDPCSPVTPPATAF